MVSKITTREYLKRYGNMTAAERQSYQDGVGQWLRSGGRMLQDRAEDYGARLQNVLGASVSWNDRECEAFEDGARLLSVLVNVGDTWLPDVLYSVSARRAIRQMVKVLRKSPAIQSIPAIQPTPALPKGVSERKEEKTAPALQPTPALPKGGGERKEERGEGRDLTGVPVRPKHIDQYVHLLPAKTQERASQVRGLLRDLDAARENARKLMDGGTHPDVIAHWSRLARQLDDRLRGIYNELDAEWEKLVKTGRVVVDAVGNVSLSPDPSPKGEGSDCTEKAELTPEQKHRRRDLRKWLIDTRRGAEGKAREKRIEQWKVNIQEYLTLEPIEAALKDEKIVAAAGHYGIQLEEFRVSG